MAAGLIPFSEIEIKGTRSRKITDETAKHFGYGVARYRGKPVQVAPYYDADGNLVAQKIRTKDKDFRILGSLDNALPFGAHAFPKGGKMIVVTEGEIDALSMSQAQQNNWPVVSIACGADKGTDADGNPTPCNKVRRYIAQHREYLSRFETVVLMFDNDGPGRASAKAAAEVLGSRARIAELPQGFKDANEMLLAGKHKEMIDAMWRAQPYRPDGLVDMLDLEDEVMKPTVMGLPWVFPTLTAHTYGRRRGELYALGAGTGIGKTDVLMQQVAMDVTELGLSVGLFFLEQEPKETAKRVAGKLAGRTFHIPDSGWTTDELAETWKKLTETGKVFLYNNFGMNDWDSIRSKMEYLAHAEGVKDFYLDNLTALVADAEDERAELKRIMGEMGGLVKSLDCTIVFVSHLATPDGKPHEEGGRVTIRHFKGAREIGAWSHYMFGLERDQQADDPTVRTTTTFRILKDRYTGRATGEVFYLGYDRDKGLLYETDKPEESKKHGFRDESDDEDDTEPNEDF